MEAGSWVIGLYWRPRRQSSLEDKARGEGKEVAKGQKVDWTKEGQKRKVDGKGNIADKESKFIEKRKNNNGRKMLA